MHKTVPKYVLKFVPDDSVLKSVNIYPLSNVVDKYHFEKNGTKV